MEPKYKRILLKVSGEALAGDKGTGLDENTVGKITDTIKKCTEMGVEIAIVVAAEISGVAEQARIWTEQELTTWVCLQLL